MGESAGAKNHHYQVTDFSIEVQHQGPSKCFDDDGRIKRTDKDGLISYEEFLTMMKAGTDWRKASRHYSRERFKSLSINLMKDGSLKMGNDGNS